MIPGAPLFMPTIRKKAGGLPPGYYCYMTAGNVFGTVFGYSGEDVYPALGIGFIDAQPVPGETLHHILYDSAGGLLTKGVTVAFIGNALAEMQSKILYVDGTLYTPNIDWFYRGDEDATVAIFTITYPEFEDGKTYLIGFIEV